MRSVACLILRARARAYSLIYTAYTRRPHVGSRETREAARSGLDRSAFLVYFFVGEQANFFSFRRIALTTHTAQYLEQLLN